ncbi:prolyl-tRNA synthetase associated domain-containing protein [Polymorphobacter arshaanensis]|uniref:Prolyl-tRNA synthetase associated domain-containing protein n=1 Tax=Glacieibacterium arshaanense TaxID=2511025 RepID=A0A4Y9EQK5_9SPHN|nr:prolyl-tRNA synthetase associated domain-containing protein [Polymorphobacter arshaanensis]TFU05885.1 prolyl-tRNA synthetase associated domain-containing protein [Polymorphobacter arshaanensis]
MNDTATAQSPAEARLHAALDALGIAWSQAEHDAVFTVEESAHLHVALPGLHSKNLFLKDAGARFWLVTVPADLRVDLKALPTVIGSKRLSFGNAVDMERLLGVTPGSVTPLAAINDGEGAVTVVLDRAVATAPCFHVHPLRNSASLALAGADLVRALGAWGHVPAVVAVPGL